MINRKPEHLSPKNPAVWTEFSRRVMSTHDLELFLDYDGTLTPIRNTPAEALPAPKTLQVLQKLTRLPQTRVIIITGRSLEDIRRLISLDNILFATNHGFHTYQDGIEWVHPEARIASPKFLKLQEFLEQSLDQFREAFIENKQFTLSIHYRNVPVREKPSIKEVIRTTIREFDPTLIITQGKEVLEVRPRIEWGKGHAVLDMLQNSKPGALPVYIGDDTTDEQAFQSLQSIGLTIRVGENPYTEAQYFVCDVKEVLDILRLILTVRSHPPKHKARNTN